MKSNKRVNPASRVDVKYVASTFAHQYLEGQDLSFAMELLMLYSRGEVGQAKRLALEYISPEFGLKRHFLLRQFTAHLLKAPPKGSASARRAVAWESFLKAEQRCKEINDRLVNRENQPAGLIDAVISRARKEVSKILGPFSYRTVSDILKLARPGGGVAIGTHHWMRTALPYKVGCDTTWTATERCAPWLRAMLKSTCLVQGELFSPEVCDIPIEIVPANKVTFVPKDGATDRSIAIEPSGNMWLQLGVHEYLARRLLMHGNSIHDQSRNQALAKLGSETGCLATLDLSAASDSISTEFVRMLLPRVWFDALDDLRCHEGQYEGERFPYHKFSSMGNGFTFALETVLFLGLVRAVNSLTGGEYSSVYGDDIIIDTCGALLITEVLEYCGFTINRDKSFYNGPFRESCGADCFAGVLCTPLYIRDPVMRSSDVYRFLNLFPKGIPHGARSYMLSSLNEKILHGLENEDAGSCLFSSFDYCRGAGRLRWSERYQTWQFQVISFKADREKLPPAVAVTSALLGHRGEHGTLRGVGVFRHRWQTRGVTPGLCRSF